MNKLLMLFVLLLAMPLVFAAPDIYEPDNSHINSTNIPADGTWQTHTFDPANDTDFINFSATAGGYYLIRTVNLTGADITDTQIFLLDRNGVTLLSADEAGLVGADWSARIVWRANTTGTYYVQVNESNGTAGGSYNISVEKQGTLSPYLVYPSSWMNASRHRTFNFTAGVTCTGGPCRDVVAVLDPRRDSRPAKLDSEVARRFASEEEVAVIVKLKDYDDGTDSLVAGRAGKADRAEMRRDLKRGIHDRQDAVLNSMDVEDSFGRGGREPRAASDVDFRLKHRYSTINGFAGTVTKSGLQKLLNNPDVEYVSFDRPVFAALDQSVPFINADDVWNLQVDGLSTNGSGQTVCVIDTGIKYDHSDFGGYGYFPNPKVVGGYDFVNLDNDPMDDYYHGSHCAGIVASQDSTYKGVAPGAALVAMKVLDATGSGYFSDIVAGIDWCVDNASTYNISVISMSIGSTAYDNNGFGCDDFEPAVTQAVEQAVSLNIFVAVAAGNCWDGSWCGPIKGLSLPGCIKNVTSVGSITLGDSFSTFSQRSIGLDLLAPGEGITSTDNIDNNHWTASGTSMATPHVAGAAALIQQYFREKYNRSISPREIEWLLKYNGISIFDAQTAMNYTRINAYSAVTSKGAVPTTVGALPFYTTTANPHDSSCLDGMADGESCNVSWMVNATGDLSNYTFFVIFETDYMSNMTDKLNITIVNSPPVLSSPRLNNGTGNTTTIFNFTVNYSDGDDHASNFINVVINGTDYPMLPADVSDLNYSDGKLYYYQTLLTEGNYTYYFNASDGFNTTSTSVVYAPNVTDNVPPQINISGPVDNANVSSALQQFMFNSSDESQDCVNCSLIFDGGMVNHTVLMTNHSAVLSHTIPLEGDHLWNISCDDGRNTAVSETRTLRYDTTPPSVALISPANSTVLYTNVSDFSFNVTDNMFSTLSCALYSRGSVYATDQSVSNATDTAFSAVALPAGSLSWLVNCTDPASNKANSSSRNVIVPQENSTASVSTTANVTYDISSTTNIAINLTTVEATAGTVAVAQFNTNPESVAASSTNGFSALGLGTFVALNASAEVVGNLSWYILNIYYSDSGLPSNMDESTLRIYYFNASSGRWQQEPDSGVDAGANRVWANITHFSTFSAGGDAGAGGTGGGGGGGGGGAVSASDEPIAVVPTYSVSLVEAPKNQQISVVYEGASYLFKVADFTGSILTIRSLPDFGSYSIANGLTSNFDLDGDGRFDIRIGYSGSYAQKAMVIFYLVQKPELIVLLPPAPRKPRERQVEELAAESEAEEAAPDPQLAHAAAPVAEPWTVVPVSESFLAKNRMLLIYLGSVAALIVIVFLVMHIFTRGPGPRPAATKEIREAVKKVKKQK